MDLRLSMKQVADGVVEHGVAGATATAVRPTPRDPGLVKVSTGLNREIRGLVDRLVTKRQRHAIHGP